jgi:F-type H+-transporting ATPase subunit b
VAAASFATGLAIYFVSLHLHTLPGIAVTLFSNPEFWVALGFVVIIAIFVRQGVPRMIGTMLDARAAAIKAELDEARRLRDEAASLLASYSAKAANAEREAEAIVADARADAERFASDARTHLRTQLERRTQMAQEKIAQAEAQAMAEIRAAAADIATAAAEKLIAARLDETRASALIEKSLKDLPEKLN